MFVELGGDGLESERTCSFGELGHALFDELDRDHSGTISIAEMNEAITRDMYVESSAYVDQVRWSLNDDAHSIESNAPAAANTEQAVAVASSSVADERMARMEADVHVRLREKFLCGLLR